MSALPGWTVFPDIPVGETESTQCADRMDDTLSVDPCNADDALEGGLGDEEILKKREEQLLAELSDKSDGKFGEKEETKTKRTWADAQEVVQ